MTKFVCVYQDSRTGEFRKKEVAAATEPDARIKFRKRTRHVLFLIDVRPKT